MLTEADVARWVHPLPDGGMQFSVAGFLLFGLMAVHNDGQTIRFNEVLLRLSRLALSRGADSSLVRRFVKVCKARRLPNKTRVETTLCGLAAFLTTGDVLAEIERAL